MSKWMSLLIVATWLTASCSSNEAGTGDDDAGVRTRDVGGGLDAGDTDTGLSDADTGTGTDVRDDAPVDDAPDDDATDAGDPDTGEDTADSDDDVESMDVDPDTASDAEACAATGATADNTVLPVDIIWIVDNSLSMEEEIEIIESRINDFAFFIDESGIDYRVVMISYDDPVVGDGWYNVCVPPPLSGAPGCPDTDSTTYRHVREIVDSTDSLEILLAQWSSFAGFLRPEAKLHIIEVSDDNSALPAGMFQTQFAALNPAPPADYTFHSIVARPEDEGDPFCDGPTCPCGYADGSVYRALSMATGGVDFSVCETDWTPIFDAIADSVVEGSILPCTYAIPDPEDYTLEIAQELVNVVFVAPDDSRTIIPQVTDGSACTGAGWYYDDPGAPTSVELCPSSCGAVDGTVEIEFGCETVKQ